MADDNGTISVSWQKLAVGAVSALVIIIGYMGNAMNRSLDKLTDKDDALASRVTDLRSDFKAANKDDSRRDTDISKLGTKVDLLMSWHDQVMWDKEHESHKRDVNMKDKVIKRKDYAVRQKDFQLKHAKEHEANVAKVLTEEIKTTPHVEMVPYAVKEGAP